MTTTKPTSSAERQAFEAAVKTLGLAITRDETGRYYDSRTERAWQAARAAHQPTSSAALTGSDKP